MKNKVKSMLQSEKLNMLYIRSYNEYKCRIAENGYIEESLTPGRYDGCFSRTSGAYVLLMVETGEIDLAVRAIRFILDTMKRNNLKYAPHLVSQCEYSNNGEIVQHLDMINQIDATAHIINAYAELVLNYGQEKLFYDYWDYISEILTNHTDQPYFLENIDCGYDVTKIQLFLNTAFEHSREARFWMCFDLLTQSFMGAALNKMIEIAKLYRRKEYIRWMYKYERLIEGIDRHLTYEKNEKKIYMEMLLPDSKAGSPFYGLGWVCLSPLAAGWWTSDEILDNTVAQVRSILWKKDPVNNAGGYLAVESDEDGYIHNWIIGKGVGWDIEYSRLRGEYGHICEWLEFLEINHTNQLYCEDMTIRDNQWVTGDCGNGEQGIWWCLAMARLRKEVGL